MKVLPGKSSDIFGVAALQDSIVVLCKTQLLRYPSYDRNSTAPPTVIDFPSQLPFIPEVRADLVWGSLYMTALSLRSLCHKLIHRFHQGAGDCTGW